MDHEKITKFGGTLSILTGISLLAFAVFFFLIPTQEPDEYWASWTQAVNSQMIWFYAWALFGVFGIGVVPAVSQLVRTENEGWVVWTSYLAYAGFFVIALNAFTATAQRSAWAMAYTEGGEPIREVITLVSGFEFFIDGNAWFRWGAPGLWVLVINVLAIRGGRWSKSLAYTGIIVGIAFLLQVVAHAWLPAIFLVVSMVGVVLGIVWFIWMGVTLRRIGE